MYKKVFAKGAIKHSNKGTFNGKHYVSGGHSEKNIKKLMKTNTNFRINRVYQNGVRFGYIYKTNEIGKVFKKKHAWFPKNWNIFKIIKAGKKTNKYGRFNGNKHFYYKFKNVIVGIIKEGDKVQTIFPKYEQE